MRRLLLLLFAAVLSVSAEVPVEPVAIGFTPQYFVDDYIVDNRWGNKQGKEMVLREFHQAVRPDAKPVIAGKGGYVSVHRDEESGLFRLWYQTWYPELRDGEFLRSNYGIAYAESKDGIQWEEPKLGLLNWQGSKENNIVWKGPRGKRASGHQIIAVPERDRRGHRFLLTYHTSGSGKGSNGLRVIGSPDGIHWDKASDSLVKEISSDTMNGIVFDERRGEYVMFCRAKDRYRRFRGDIMDTGASRRVSRMSHTNLWEEWPAEPRSVLIPDALDAADNFNAFYGMGARYHAGIYWCSLWVFRFNDNIYSEFVSSRNGFDFNRAPIRKPLIPLGEEGAWDSHMIFASPDWVEVGDEWRIYYAGWNGPHGTRERTPGIGFATLRKGGFVSLRGPKNGGGVVTRKVVWPGGELRVNCDARDGELRVRISGDRRDPLPGFNYEDCVPFTGDSTAHSIRWKDRSLDELKGRQFRIEFSLQSADLYSFQAAGGERSVAPQISGK